MEKIYAAVVTNSLGSRYFYIGAATEAQAVSLLRKEKPNLDGEVRFAQQPGNIAEPLGVTLGSIIEWDVGAPVRLSALTGSIE